MVTTKITAHVHDDKCNEMFPIKTGERKRS